MKFLIFSTLLFLHLISCGERSSVTHPIEEHLPLPSEISNVVTVNLSDAEKKEAASISSVFTNNDSLHFFDYPKALDYHDGLFYLLENRKNHISVFDTLGNFQYQFSRAGHGPGEVISPVTFKFNDDYSELYILDAYDIEIFEKISGRFVPKKTVYHGLLRAYDMCILDESYYLSGYGISKEQLEKYQNNEISHNEFNVSGPINKYSIASDSLEIAFGFKYKSYFGYKTFGGMMSNVMISCNSLSKTILAQHEYFPYLFGYDKEGDLRWLTKLEGYLTSNLLEEIGKNGSYNLTQYSNSKIFQRFSGFNPSSTNENFIQFQKYIPQSSFREKDYTEVEINKIKYQGRSGIRINSETGKSTYFESDDWLVIEKDGFRVWYNKFKEGAPYEIERI